jgi:four helix bundle protein
MQEFRNLKVWQNAHELVLAVYDATATFPRDERYRLAAQMRGAAVSIPSNIAEGCGRGGLPELIQFSQVSFGSATELEYQLLLARDLGYVDEPAFAQVNDAVVQAKRMLGALLTTLRGRAGKPRTLGVRPYAARTRKDSVTEALKH